MVFLYPIKRVPYVRCLSSFSDDDNVNVTITVSEQRGLIHINIYFDPPVSSGNVDLIYKHILSALMQHMVPAIAGYIKIGCWEIQLKFETFSFTFEIIVLKSPVRILVENNLNILTKRTSGTFLAFFE